MDCGGFWLSQPYNSIVSHEESQELLKRITFEADKCGGRPCIRGMRIRVVDIMEMLLAEMSHKEILEDFPYLEQEDIRAAMLYATKQLDHSVISA